MRKCAIALLLCFFSGASAERYKLFYCDETSITVTDEAAATGSKSLKFTDNPNAERSGYPYLVVQPAFMANNTTRFACDLMLEEDSVVSIQFRKTHSGKGVLGPQLRLIRGTITCSGKFLAQYNPSQWIRLEMELRLADGNYAVSVGPLANDPTIRKELAFKDAAFDSCTWVGVLGNGNIVSSFYLDNLVLELAEQAD